MAHNFMPIVELDRLEENEEYGTFGAIRIQKKVFCVTLEPPDRENAQNISSIPAQQYIAERYSSDAYPNSWQITDVPGRDLVLCHAGNLVEHTEGCVIFAQYWGKLATPDGHARAVLNSGRTMDMFNKIMGNHERFHLTIKEHF